MSKKIRFALLITFIIAAVFSLSSCNKKEKETVDLQTTLSVQGKNDTISGKRTMVLTFPESVISPGSEADTNLAKVIQKYKPDSMNYSRTTVDGKIQYTLEIPFKSHLAYYENTSDAMGEHTPSSISHPDTIMTKGWRIKEEFQSIDLIQGWLSEGIKKEDFGGLDFDIVESKTFVSLDNKIEETSPVIQYNELHGNPIEKIRIKTTKTSADSDRTSTHLTRSFVFTITKDTYDSDPENIEKYFLSRTESASSVTWPLNDELQAYEFTFVYDDCSPEKLETCTKNLLASNYGDLQYVSNSEGSTVLAKQNLFNETLDFSNYITHNSNPVPIEYIYSIEENTELSSCQISENDIWKPAETLDEDRYGTKCAIKYADTILKLRINDGTQYQANSINIESIPLSGDELEKNITFRFDLNKGGKEASEYVESFLKKRYDVVSYNEGEERLSKVTISGSTESLSDMLSDILSIKDPNQRSRKNSMTFSHENQPMTLRTMNHYTDKIDLSALLIGVNKDVTVNYSVKTQSGDIIKSFSYKSSSSDDSGDSDLSVDDDHTAWLRNIKGSVITVSFDITTPNEKDIVFFSVISVIMVLIAAAMMFWLSKKPLPAIGLGSGSSSSGLPGGNKDLAVRKQKNSSIRKKK